MSEEERETKEPKKRVERKEGDIKGIAAGAEDNHIQEAQSRPRRTLLTSDAGPKEKGPRKGSTDKDKKKPRRRRRAQGRPPRTRPAKPNKPDTGEGSG